MKVLLWKVRDEKGYTLQQLSVASGVSKSQINDIENSKKSPTLLTLEKLAVALNCKISDLFVE